MIKTAISRVAALALLGAIVGAALPAAAQSGWENPGPQVTLNDAQSKAAGDLVARLNDVMLWTRYQRCYLTNQGQCPNASWPNMGEKANAERWVAAAQACVDAAAAAAKTGIPPTQQFSYDDRRETVAINPIPLRNAPHQCNLIKWRAEQHLMRVAAGIGSVGNYDDGELESLAQEVGVAAGRMTRWAKVLNCYEKLGDGCRKQPDIRQAEYAKEWPRDGERCMAALARVQKAKLPENFPVPLAVNGYPGIGTPETLGALDKLCRSEQQRATAYVDRFVKAEAAAKAASEAAEAAKEKAAAAAAPAGPALNAEQKKIINDLFQNSPSMTGVPETFGKPMPAEQMAKTSDTIPRMLAGDAQTCMDLVDRAIKAGVPKDYPFEFPVYDSGLKSPMPLQTYRDAVCVKAKTILAKYLEARTALEDAKLAPYYAVLKGDRLRIFKERHLQDLKVSGPGGGLLSSPASFAAAPAWYTTGTEQSGPQVRWVVDGWQFDGDKLLRTFSDSGWGRSAPSSAYPEGKGTSGSDGGGGFFGFVFWLIWTAIRLAILLAVLLAAYTWYGQQIPAIETLIDRVPRLREVLGRLPIPRRQAGR